MQPFPPAREIRLAVPQADLHRDFAFIKFSGWRRQLCAVQRFAVAAFANSFSALLPFLLLQAAEERGAAAEDGQASGGMIKREFSMRSWRAGGHFFNLTTAAATDVRDVVEVGIAGVDVRLAQRTTPSFLPSRTRRHLRSPTIVERMDHIRRRRTACELAERK